MSDEIPRAIRALWGADEEPRRRGPKPAMTVADIAAAGVAIADTEGLPAVSMAAVAKRLGVSTMALYRYVDAKDTLLAVMVDVAYGPVSDLSPRPWRAALSGWAQHVLTALRAHPWVVDVRSPTPPLTPNAIGWMDAGLGVLLGAGLDHQRAASALLVVDGYVRNHVQMEQQYAGDGAASWGRRLGEVLPGEGLDAVRAGLSAGVFDDEPGDEPFPGDQFGFGLDLVLDGVERLVRG